MTESRPVTAFSHAIVRTPASSVTAGLRADVRGDPSFAGVEAEHAAYVAGLTAADSTQDIKGQTKQILERIDHYLKEAGTDKSKLLRANLWIKDMAMFADMNSVWNAWVDPENPPARACVQASLARPEVLVEIMVIAAK
jgi:enamine deaminase RidA (YjgF/YER057c/UK114 family)